MNPYLQFRNVTKRFGATVALDDVTLSVEEGATTALLGPNGAGKSTLFNCLLGFCQPTLGGIQLGGRPLRAHDRSRFGYVCERVALYPNRTCFENAAFFAGLKGCSNEDVLHQLKRVQLTRVANRPVRQLSKGMLQRLGLAIALLGQPDLLLLDEPFNGLDPIVLDEFTAILREEQERGATLIISTHTISAIEPLASDVAILLGGRLAFRGSAEDLDEPLESVYQRIARKRSLVAEEALV